MKIISENNCDAVTLACQYLREGKVVSFATDTVYGMAVNAADTKAVERLYSLKKRDLKKPIAVFVKDLETAEKIFCFDEISKKLAAKFLPGSLTLVLQQRPDSLIKIADNLTSAENFLGFRIVNHDFVQNLMRAFDGVLAVSSANISRDEPAIDAQAVQDYFANVDLDLLIDGGRSVQKTASTVVKISDKKVEILRHGAIAESLIKISLDL